MIPPDVWFNAIGYAVCSYILFWLCIKTLEILWCLYVACWMSWSVISGAYKAGKGKELEWKNLPEFIYRAAKQFHDGAKTRLDGFEWSFYGREVIND